MRQLMRFAAVGFVLLAFGCAGMQTSGPGQAITKDTKIKCPKCGVEFSVGEGMQANP